MRQDYAKNRQVAEAFYQHTRRAVEESEFPVLEVNGPQQRGGDFGTRLANAVADAFAQGYDRVIAVGSDCATLHEVDWVAVSDQLDDGSPVLGPTADQEGAYLIGLHRSQFEKEAFASLPWQAPGLLSALTRYLEGAAGTAPSFLTSRDDVNGHGDLVALLRAPTTIPSSLIDRLRDVLGPVLQRAPRAPVATDSSRRGHRSRAPPFLSTSRCGSLR